MVASNPGAESHKLAVLLNRASFATMQMHSVFTMEHPTPSPALLTLHHVLLSSVLSVTIALVHTHDALEAPVSGILHSVSVFQRAKLVKKLT